MHFREIGLKLIPLIRKSYKRTGSCHRVVDACESYKIPNISKSVARTKPRATLAAGQQNTRSLFYRQYVFYKNTLGKMTVKS